MISGFRIFNGLIAWRIQMQLVFLSKKFVVFLLSIAMVMFCFYGCADDSSDAEDTQSQP